MNILYIGQPETERSIRWTSFLGEQFDNVDTASLADLGSLDFTGFDLAIVDGDLDGDLQPPPQLRADDLPLPTILVGGMGGEVADAMRLKLGILLGCICLTQEAIISDKAMRHDIFRGPVPVSIPDLRLVPEPEHFLQFRTVTQDASVLAVADIYEPTPEELVQNHAPGLVSTSTGFLDSPDCEHILGGMNSKEADYNAIARQGRFLQWGFWGEPDRMTDFGRQLFLNAVHYISRFAATPVEALATQTPRDSLRQYLTLLDKMGGYSPQDILQYLFGSEIPARIGTNAASAVPWFDHNRGALRFVGTVGDGWFEVDEDLLVIGIDNDDPAFLHRIAADLDVIGDIGERARRLWDRYVAHDRDDTESARLWLHSHFDRMFFSDRGGYRWIARDDLPLIDVHRTNSLSSGDPNLWLVVEQKGRTIELHLHIVLAPGDYIYGPEATDGFPTTVEVVSDHELVTPPVFPDSPKHHLTGHVTIPLTVRGPSNDVNIAIRLQICNVQACKMPTTFNLVATVGNRVSG